jgi:hypothetical protein
MSLAQRQMAVCTAQAASVAPERATFFKDVSCIVCCDGGRNAPK